MNVRLTKFLAAHNVDSLAEFIQSYTDYLQVSLNSIKLNIADYDWFAEGWETALKKQDDFKELLALGYDLKLYMNEENHKRYLNIELKKIKN